MLRIGFLLGTLVLVGSTERSSGAPSQNPARLVVRSIPTGATITVDGTPIGVAEIEYGVIPGKHVVMAALAGHETSRREIQLSAGDTQVVTMFLLPAEPAQGSSLRVWKWVTAGVAVAAIGAGVWLLALGDSPRFDGLVRQETANNDTALGAALLGVGAATAGVSCYLFYRDSKNGPVAAVAQLGPGSLFLSARF